MVEGTNVVASPRSYRNAVGKAEYCSPHHWRAIVGYDGNRREVVATSHKKRPLLEVEIRPYPPQQVGSRRGGRTEMHNSQLSNE